MPTTRWFAVGSAGESEREAGLRAADEALVHDDAKLLIAFCSPSHDLPALVQQIRARSEGVALIGCTTAGEIATSGPQEASVVVAALGGDGFVIETAAATGASKDLRAAGAHVARCLPSSEYHPCRALLLLTDGLAGDQQEIIRGAYGVLGAAVPLVGGCAGDDLEMRGTFQLFGDQVLTDSVVAAGIASDAPLGIGVRHGWQRVGEPMLVTSSAGNQVYALDDRPALDVYLEQSGAVGPECSNAGAFIRLAMTHPLGLSSHTGEEQVRYIGGADFAERSLSCIAEVPQGGLVWIMGGDAESVLRATDGACGDSLAALDGHPPLGLLAFDCIGRRGVLGDEGIQAEVGRLAAIGAGAPVAGFYTYGEIARTRGMRGFHNQTLVVLSIA
ncbi:MAG TPA: FIST N-terminal domain-containing protein [Actinomycetota bacterium]|nr:FIST N-terminal domain-containing protein [Actinomycetota bacterium]